jgi:hypothetical protein
MMAQLDSITARASQRIQRIFFAFLIGSAATIVARIYTT